MTDLFNKLKTVLNNPDSLICIPIKELKQSRRLCAGADLRVHSGLVRLSISKKSSPFNVIAL